MRKFDDNKLKNMEIKPHNIILTYTTEIDYEMKRQMLLENIYGLDDKYLYLESYHCSCYGFDDSAWEGITYNASELIKLANAEYNKNSIFWQMVKDYFRLCEGMIK